MPSKVFSLSEAASRLGVSERTILRLIRSGKLIAEKRPHAGKRRWIIEEWAIARFKLLEWLDRQMSDVPPPQGYEGHFGAVFVYGKWGEETTAYRRLPCYELTVSLDELWRYAYKPRSTREEYEARKSEIRTRLPGRPEDFEVRFRLDDKTISALMAIVNSVRPPIVAGLPVRELKADALTHLVQKTLPNLRRVRRDLRAYLRRAVRNYYNDRLREMKRSRKYLQADISDVADLDE